MDDDGLMLDIVNNNMIYPLDYERQFFCRSTLINSVKFNKRDVIISLEAMFE